MRHQLFSGACVLACATLLTTTAGAARRVASGLSGAFAAHEQKQDKDNQKSGGATAAQGQTAPNVSEAEAKALKKIETAATTQAKLQAASDFVKKYPQSPARARLADYLAGQVNAATDTAQKISLGESYVAIFNAPGEAARVDEMLVDAYLKSQRLDDAFRVGALALAANPDDVVTLTSLAYAGINAVLQNNTKYQQQSEQYALKAADLLTADKRPSSVAEAQWPAYKASWLPRLYYALAILSYKSNNVAEAQARAERAAAANSDDPHVYLMLANIANDEYQKLASQYNSTHAPAMLQQAQDKLDRVIDLYAHAVALAEARPETKSLSDQLMPDLQNYYKFRHNNSTEGLQQLIAKYRPAPAAQ